jgi:hypothetical protein
MKAGLIGEGGMGGKVDGTFCAWQPDPHGFAARKGVEFGPFSGETAMKFASKLLVERHGAEGLSQTTTTVIPGTGAAMTSEIDNK